MSATELILRKGDHTEIGAFTGAEGEIAIDTTAKTVVVQDGATAGGIPLLRSDLANLGSSLSISLTSLTLATSLLFSSTGLIATVNANDIGFKTNTSAEQVRMLHTASAVNRLTLTGGAAASGVTIAADGSDSNININITPLGTGSVVTTKNLTAASLTLTGSSIPVNGTFLPTTNTLGWATNSTSRMTLSTATLQINWNAAAVTATGKFHLIGADATGNTFVMDGFAGINTLSLRRAGGTGASPTATTASGIAQILFQGWTTAAYATGAAITGSATETWSTSARGSSLTFQVTLNGTTTLAAALTLSNDKTATFQGDLYLTPGGSFAGGRNLIVSNVDTGGGSYAQIYVQSDYGILYITATSIAAGQGHRVYSSAALFSLGAASANVLYLSVSQVYFHNAGSAGTPALSVIGDLDTGVYFSAADKVDITGAGARIARFSGTASAVNYLDFYGNITAGGVRIGNSGSDTNISTRYYTKGTGQHQFYGITNTVPILLLDPIASGVTYLKMTANVTGQAPTLLALGETNVELRLSSNGSAGVRLTGDNTTQTLGYFQGGVSLVNFMTFAAAASGANASISVNGANLLLGAGAAISTSATDGHVMIPSCAGTPTGVPTGNGAGKIAMVYDTSANKIWFYNGSWRGILVV